MAVYIRREALAGRSGHDAGRALLKAVYEEVAGGPLPELAIAPGGKPYFPGSPWHFSISHTAHFVWVALSTCPVGLDCEELERKVPEKLAGRVLSPEELAQYEAAPDKNRALLTFWVLKEANAKCTGRGIQYPENHTNFSLRDPRVRQEEGCLVAVITEEDYAV